MGNCWGLVLQALKEGQKTNPRITGTMPLVQYRDYNRLIARVRCVNIDLAMVVELIRQATQTLEARLGWLATVHGAMLRSHTMHTRHFGTPQGAFIQASLDDAPRRVGVCPARPHSGRLLVAATNRTDERPLVGLSAIPSTRLR